MISAISQIQYGDNERSRLWNRVKGELYFKYVIKESTMSCVGSEKNEQ